MISNKASILFGSYLMWFLMTMAFMLVATPTVDAQEMPPRPSGGAINPEAPPRPITVNIDLSQNLSFGAFYHGNIGGSVIIYPTGSRSATGDVILLGMGYSFSTGLLEVIGYPGTLVSILNGPPATLIGSNGGMMTLSLGDYLPSSPFIITTIPPDATQIRVGGTLTVGNPLSNPPGNYSGTFDIILVQE